MPSTALGTEEVTSYQHAYVVSECDRRVPKIPQKLNEKICLFWCEINCETHVQFFHEKNSLWEMDIMRKSCMDFKTFLHQKTWTLYSILHRLLELPSQNTAEDIQPKSCPLDSHTTVQRPYQMEKMLFCTCGNNSLCAKEGYKYFPKFRPLIVYPEPGEGSG